jgi:hypothetical protein
MSSENPATSTVPATPPKPGFKQKATHELKEFFVITLYLAVLFCALTTYTMLLLRKYDISYLNYTFAIINALIIAKVILIGEMAHLGRRAEARPLHQSVIYKAFLYSLLVFAFHFLEEFIKRLIHHKPIGTVLHDIDYNDLSAKTIVIFCVFVPLFAVTELRRVLGEDRFHALFHSSPPADNPTLSAGD